MPGPWVVLLEAVDSRHAGGVTCEDVQRLIRCLAPFGPSGLCCLDRYAVQIVIPALEPELALGAALGEWRRACAETGLPEWDLVRAEVKTLAELEAEHGHSAAVHPRPETRTCCPTSASRRNVSAGRVRRRPQPPC